MSWLGQIMTHHREEPWSNSLCQTLFVMTTDSQIPVITEKPLVTCGCRNFYLDVIGDHLCTCTTQSGVKKSHYWVVEQLVDIFHTTHTVKTQNATKIRGRHCVDIDDGSGTFGAGSPHYRSMYDVTVKILTNYHNLLRNTLD